MIRCHSRGPGAVLGLSDSRSATRSTRTTLWFLGTVLSYLHFGQSVTCGTGQRLEES